MKQFFLLGIVVLITLFIASSLGATKQKRFASLESIFTIGGRAGCVVVENSPNNYTLYINGRYTKSLTKEEQEEYNTYNKNLAQFKIDNKIFFEKVKKEKQSQFRRLLVTDKFDSKIKEPVESTLLPKPEQPKKPSFCMEKNVTQYIFNGCSVQNGKLYIGDNYVRDLTSDESKELEIFEKKLNEYKKSFDNIFQQRIQEIFGLNNDEVENKLKITDVSNVTSSEKSAKKNKKILQIEAPKAPNFCVLID